MKSKQPLYQKWCRWLAQTFAFQLYLTYVTWPFLLWWGMPLSLASPIGNLIFAPFLMGFLLVATLIFFCYFLSIPSFWLISLVNVLSEAWLYLATHLPLCVLVTFARPPLWSLPLFPCIATLVIMHPFFAKPNRSILCFVALFIGTGLLLTRIAPTTVIRSLKNNILLVHHADHTIMIVGGNVAHTRMPSLSWINYTLIPLLTTTTGKQTIDTIIMCSCTPAICSFIEQVATILPITKIVAPAGLQFTKLPVEHVQQRSCITLDSATHVTLTKVIHKKRPCLHITGFCGEHPIHLGCTLI